MAMSAPGPRGMPPTPAMAATAREPGRTVAPRSGTDLPACASDLEDVTFPPVGTGTSGQGFSSRPGLRPPLRRDDGYGYDSLPNHDAVAVQVAAGAPTISEGPDFRAGET